MQEVPEVVTARIARLAEKYEDARQRYLDAEAELATAKAAYEGFAEALDSAKYITNVICGSDL